MKTMLAGAGHRLSAFLCALLAILLVAEPIAAQSLVTPNPSRTGLPGASAFTGEEWMDFRQNGQRVTLPVATAFGQAISASTSLTSQIAALSGATVPGNLVAIAGDSIAALNDSTSGSPANDTSEARGYLRQAQAFSMGRWDTNKSLDFGVGGDTTADLLARISAITAAKPKLVVLQIGTNDAYSSSPHLPVANAAASWSNYQQIVAQLVAAGIKVIAMPVLPRNYSGETTAGRQWLWSLNHSIKATLPTLYSPSQVYVSTADQAILDPTSAVGGGVTAAPYYTVDGLHPLVYGASLIGLVLSREIETMLGVPSGVYPRVAISAADVFDATANPYGLLNAGAGMIGTGGTAGTGITGSVATGWQLARNSGSTITGTASKDTDGAQLIALGGSGTGANNESLRLLPVTTPSLTGVPVGAKIVAEFDVEATGLSGVRGVYAYAQPSSGVATIGMNPSTVTSDREVAAFRKRIVTPPLVVLSTSGAGVAPFLYILCDASAAAPTGTIKVRFGGIRVVP